MVRNQPAKNFERIICQSLKGFVKSSSMVPVLNDILILYFTKNTLSSMVPVLNFVIIYFSLSLSKKI